MDCPHGVDVTSFSLRVLLAVAVSTTVIVWASSFVVIRSIGTDFTPGPMALARVAIAAAVLTPVVLARHRSSLVPPRRLLVAVGLYGAMW